MYKLRTYDGMRPSWKSVAVGQSSLATNTMIAPTAVHFYRRASKLVVPTMTAAILLNFLRLKLRWTGQACPSRGRTTNVGERSSGKRKLGTTAGERRSRHAPYAAAFLLRRGTATLTSTTCIKCPFKLTWR